MQKKIILILLSAFLMILFNAQFLAFQESEKEAFNPENTYAINQLKEDFTLLRTALEEAHGGLYFYTPKEEMESLFDQLFAGLDHPQNRTRILWLFSPSSRGYQ